MTTDLLLLPTFYLLGCLTSGYYLVRMFKNVDIRDHGLGSTGARDVARVLGPWGLVTTSGFDLIKGAVTVWLGTTYGSSDWITPAGIVLMLVGHIWPVQLGFRGGRGVMPAIGAVALFDPILMGVFAALLVPVYVVLRRLTLSGMIVVAFAPVIAFVLGRTGNVLLLLCIISPIILMAHWKTLREDLGLMPK
jgi:glycerol-3-phosphate acyltransferase PlsY